ncbi:DUF1730 domain-containing protein [Candidatus Gracilibacteria bacterium]|nr:DUF1730 domain-containing protein [Candidatus Gracilibacteria bacterium]
MRLQVLEDMHMRQQITDFAKSLGFDLVGFSPAKIDERYLQAFDEWLANNHEADMSYMQKVQQRRDLTEILPNAKSVIVLATNYHNEQSPLKKDHGRVARYAFGRDYHKIISKRLKKLRIYIEELAPQSQNKAYVDTGPILERALAEQAGIGRIGKNAMLITPEFGSWVFLSEIITTIDLGLPLAPSPPSNSGDIPRINTAWSNPSHKPANVCGACTKCVDACPTGAIIAPGVIDSRLCISYLTIENRDKIPPKLAKIIAKQKLLYGCDICQEVCPHNQKRQLPSDLAPTPIAGDQIATDSIPKTDELFLERFAGSPLMRAKRKGLTRNAEVLSQNRI